MSSDTRRLDARIRALLTDLAELGGVARMRTLRERGASAHVLDVAVARGLVTRPRKGWIADAGADPDLRRAAAAGVVITCVSQARRLGLWVPAGADASPHVAAAAHAGGVRAERARVHWSAPVLPRHPDRLVDDIENVLDLVARCQPRETALVIWESALNGGLVTKPGLARLSLCAAARAVLAAATPWADSGLETMFATRLSWLRLPIVPQVWIAGHRVDFLIGDRLVVQIDGGHHVGRQRSEDIAHDAALMLLGYHVIRVGYTQVVERWPDVQLLIMQAVAAGRHLAA